MEVPEDTPIPPPPPPAPPPSTATAPVDSHYSPELRHRYQNAAVYSNLSNSIIGYIVTGQLMLLYANDVLQFNTPQISLILTLIPLGQIVRFAMLHLTRRYSRIQIVTFSCIIRLTTLGLVLAIPAATLAFPTFLGLILYFNYSQSVADVFWQPLLRDITTTQDRGSFFGRMRFWFQLVHSISMGLITLMVGKQITQGQYKLAIALAFVGVANFLYWSFKLPDLRETRSPDESLAESWRHLWHVTKTSPLLRRPLLINFIVTFAVVPVMTIYQRKLLHIPANVISFNAFIGAVGAALGLLFWGRISDRIGFRPLINGLFLLMILISPLHLIIAPFPAGDFAWTSIPAQCLLTIAALLCLSFFGGFFGSGIGIGSTTLQHFHVRRHEVLEAMNLLAMVSNLAASLAAAWCGFLLNNVALPRGDIPFLHNLLHLDYIKIYVLVGIISLRFLVIALCSRLPNSHPNQSLRHFYASLIPFRPK